MQPPLFIINPVCGTRKAADEIARLLARVDHLYGEVAVVYTERSGHAEELARAGAAAGHPLIVAVGGDGTFGEVANGVLRAGDEATGADPPGERPPSGWPASAGLRSREPAVGLVSIGTGGDFRRTLGIGAGIEASLGNAGRGDRPVYRRDAD